MILILRKSSKKKPVESTLYLMKVVKGIKIDRRNIGMILRVIYLKLDKNKVDAQLYRDFCNELLRIDAISPNDIN